MESFLFWSFVITVSIVAIASYATKDKDDGEWELEGFTKKNNDPWYEAPLIAAGIMLILIVLALGY